MFIDRSDLADIQAGPPPHSMPWGICVAWLIALVYGAMIVALVAGLVVGKLSGTLKRIEMPQTKTAG